MARSRRGLIGTLLSSLALLMVASGCEDCERPDGIPPPVPSGVYSITGDGMVEIFWDPIRGVDDLAGYGIYRADEDSPDGPYVRMGQAPGPNSDYYVDETAVNGVTYYYAIDAYDFDGNESELSWENVFDTPRPARAGLRVYSRQERPHESGVDFSEQPRHDQMLVGWDDASTDIFIYTDDDGVMRVVGTVVEEVRNDLQDMGWTSGLDEIGYAPEEGWVESSAGLELVEGHTYVLWTCDGYFAKFRVANISWVGHNVVIDWAYQVDPGNPELMRPKPTVERS